ncbi:protein arginine methyltransferase NDUFAF7, mitochondrial-like isoform X2 [Stegodyphus dumicola]|uniref:protein arginine methyltransferase NDUFAF7, mitochondrial-like isoform X2 n=1 Tax=Stegodyphus dumicola TaxID=202533 RepID=UPI0015AA80C0|nr:protein arginine methyltransferase NDUFAF7, mitochondrial-like isoform X2 [Stegodyphus dumicola]
MLVRSGSRLIPNFSSFKGVRTLNCGSQLTKVNYDANIKDQRRFSAKAQAKTKETKLVQQMKSRISATGPVTVAEYMKEVCINPMSGYYMHRDVIGSSGVIKSPEIFQLFGDVIAEWCLNEWIRAGKPKPWYIVEIGPNRGALSDELLRVFSQNNDAREVVSLHLVEVSPHLSQLQELKLCGTVSVVKDVLEADDSRRHLHLHTNHDNDEMMYKHNITKHGVPVSWYRNLEDVPEGFSCVVAYELFDAFPIHKLQAGETRTSLEVSPESGVLIQEIAARIEKEGGYSLLIDYGHDGTKTDTFRAFRRHELHDPLSEPGTADLTADVDFSYLKKMVQGKALTYGPVTQQEFLTNMDIKTKFEKILSAAKPEIHKDLIFSYDMLLGPEHMGERFKFLGLFPLDMSDTLQRDPPSGFTKK